MKLNLKQILVILPLGANEMTEAHSKKFHAFFLFCLPYCMNMNIVIQARQGVREPLTEKPYWRISLLPLHDS